jgi:signal transduction histidine kinase
VRESPDGIVIVDGAGVVRFANPAALALLGRPAEAVQGRPFEFPLTMGRPCELTLPGPDGERAAEMRLAEIEWRGCKATLATIRDITALRKLERIRAEIQERRRLDRQKDDLLGAVSHELRTPLSIIMAAVGAVRDRLAGPLTEGQAEMIAAADRNLARMTRMLDNFLDLSRLESGGALIDRKALALGEMLQELADDLRMIHRENDVELLVDIPPELPLVNGDKDMLIQVIGNLLANALRHARSRIRVRASRLGGEIVVSVTDDGAGIPEGKSSELFDKFVQLERRKGGNGYKGTGLGLAICREIVGLHGGRIWGENVKGWGASFTFALPVALPGIEPASSARRIIPTTTG